MNITINLENIRNISTLLEQEPDIIDNCYTWSIENSKYSTPIYFSIYLNVNIENQPTALISIQTVHGYYELHNVTNFTVFPPDELFFSSLNNDKISSLIISKNSGVSLFANISKDILNSEIAELDSSLVLAALQLSIINK